MEKYTEIFIKVTGGQFLWSEFRKDTMSKYFLYSLIYAVAGFVLGAVFWHPLYLLVVGSIFLLLAMVGLVTLFSDRMKSIVLIDHADMSKAKYALYLCIYTGVFGCIILLLPAFF